MSYPYQPREDIARPNVQPPSQPPVAWELPLSPQPSLPVDDQQTVVLPKRVFNIASSLSATSPWGRTALIFVLGAILGVIVGYVTGHASVATAPRSTTTVNAPTSSTPIYNVTRVTGTSIMSVGPDGLPMLILTTNETTYQRAGLPAKFSDITAGSRIMVKGNQGTTYKRTASRILILDATISGKIQSIKDGNLVVKALAGSSISVALHPRTQIQDAVTHKSVNQSALHAGQTVHVYGEMTASGTFDAILIAVNS